MGGWRWLNVAGPPVAGQGNAPLACGRRVEESRRRPPKPPHDDTQLPHTAPWRTSRGSWILPLARKPHTGLFHTGVGSRDYPQVETGRNRAPSRQLVVAERDRRAAHFQHSSFLVSPSSTTLTHASLMWITPRPGRDGRRWNSALPCGVGCLPRRREARLTHPDPRPRLPRLPLADRPFLAGIRPA